MGDARHGRRPVRSFVRRAGRLTRAQARALEDAWPRYGIVLGDKTLDLVDIFGRRAPIVLEIGFGDGECLAALARRHPERDYVGIEVHEPGIGHLLLALEAGDIPNVRVIADDAVEALPRLPSASLAAVHLFFPDPWPKKRHHKRRIVQEPFLAELARVVAPGGYLHMATDWAPYAEHMLETAGASRWWDNTSPSGSYVERPASRPETKFERRGQRLGQDSRDLVFERNRMPAPS